MENQHIVTAAAEIVCHDLKKYNMSIGDGLAVCELIKQKILAVSFNNVKTSVGDATPAASNGEKQA